MNPPRQDTAGLPEEDHGLLRSWVAEGGPRATRAAVVLLASQGLRNAEIARRLEVSRQTVGHWRQRFDTLGMEGLRERPRPGRPSIIDEAEVITRTVLAPDGSGASRAVARELGYSHAAVAAIRQRWRVTPGNATVPVVPTRPPLPEAEVWVLGLYLDTHRALLLVGTSPAADERHRGASPGADVIAAVDAAVEAALKVPPSPAPGEGRGQDRLTGYLDEARRRHPGASLHAITLWDTGEGGPQAERCARGGVVHHALPVRTTWRTFLRAVVGLDSTRHPESSHRVYLDLAAALTRYADRPGTARERQPVRWLREPIATHFADASRADTDQRRESWGGANQIDLGSFNECVVIEAVRLAGTITRGEISHRTGLTQQSVSRISRSLLRRGILVEDDRRQATSGKPRTPVRLRGDAGHALGIHVDPEVLTAVVVDLDGAIVRSRTEPVAQTASPDQLVDHIARLGRGVLSAAGGAVRPGGFLGIGVATPGPVDVASGTVLDPPLLSVWRDVPLLYMLKDRFRCPIVMEKDSSAAAIGERWIGRNRRARDFVYLYLGTGVGAGLFINGDIHRGVSANAGEFGQLCAVALERVDADGRPEILPECNPPVSIPETAARLGMALGPRAAHDPRGAHRAVSAAAGAGDPVAEKAVRQVAGAIGRGALSLVDLLDIDLVVLGGPFFTDGVADLYTSEISRIVNDFPTARRLRRVDVERSVLGREAAAVGAASTIFHATFTPRLAGRPAPMRR
ncbi:ROK family protein [Streptomyces malaysiensis]|uniref:ROK family protein n=1 Tax=Streptomyces malaysiensis TaxID=92644 RepID=A0A7X5WZ10_STRMQ|nr:ROK family protein [Streptomyces malaysiensis]NIY63628.1 ROK family protein [Streptomyces malaysiensis]